MTMGPDDQAAKASGGSGWTIPADYSDVHALLRELRLGPYKDLGRVTPGQILSLYWPHLVAGTVGIFLISLFAFKSWILNRRLNGSMENLSHRTIALNASKEALEEANRELSREVETRKSAEETSSRSVSLLRATIESTNDGILVVDRVLSVMIIFTILISLIMFSVSHLIFRPLRKLMKAMEKVTEGNYGYTIKLDRKDEIGDLIRMFNNMISIIITKNMEMEAYSGNLEDKRPAGTDNGFEKSK